MLSERQQNIAFFVLLGLSAVLITLLFWPFITVLAMAGILSVLFKPWFLRLQKKTKSENLAALLTLLLVLLIVLVPLALIGFALYSETADIYTRVTEGNFNVDINAIISHLPGELQGPVQNFLSGLAQRISGFAGGTVHAVTQVISNVARFLLMTFLAFFSMYYFLKDSEKIKKFFVEFFPISGNMGGRIVNELEKAILGVVKGSVLVALVQAVVATVGFFIFGLPNPFLWGAITAVAALVPTLGTSLVTVPAAAYLFLTGHNGQGIGMLIWAALAVSMIDNFIGPKIVGSSTRLHPLAVLLSVLGGIELFGLLGFLFGPILLALFVAMLNIYKSEFNH